VDHLRNILELDPVRGMRLQVRVEVEELLGRRARGLLVSERL